MFHQNKGISQERFWKRRFIETKNYGNPQDNGEGRSAHQRRRTAQITAVQKALGEILQEDKLAEYLMQVNIWRGDLGNQRKVWT